MSVGNNTQAVNFDANQLTLVLGNNLDLGGDGSRNGTGKTTIINALSYALYGEALTNIRRDNLINKTNGKGMVTTVDFEINGKDYRIERGRKPNVLKFYVDGVESKDDEQQGDSRETQKDIEKVIGFPHNMFKHLIALNTYTDPFLSMKTNDQKEMIEQLLGITEISLKAEVLKERLKETKDRMKEEEMRIKAVSDSNQRIEKNVKEIETRSAAWEKSFTDKTNQMSAALKTLSELDVNEEIEIHKCLSDAKELQLQWDTLNKESKTLSNSCNRSETRIADLKSNIADAEAGVCPACGQGTEHLSTHAEYKAELQEKLDAEIAHHTEQHNKLTEVVTALNNITVPECDKTFYPTIEEAYEHKHNLESLTTQLEEKRTEKNPYVEQIEVLRDTGFEEIDYENMNALDSLREHQEFLHKLLTSKDSFIRKKIIDQNLQYLNYRLSHYLDKLGLPHEVKFNNDLSVDITEYGRDLDFDNLSRGERNRLILGMSWAFRDIYESLNQPMNLMCIDELVDSGMDTTGVENALAVLKKMGRESNKNVFLISHKEELQGRVNNVLYVIKEGGFTSYSNDIEIVET